MKPGGQSSKFFNSAIIPLAVWLALLDVRGEEESFMNFVTQPVKFQ